MKLLIVALMLTGLSACVSADRSMACAAASAQEGWFRIEKPEEIPYRKSRSGSYLAWFEHPDGMVMVCEKTRQSCSEVTILFAKLNGRWAEGEIVEVVICD